ncbi:MAG: hypothetical protein HW402_1231, partial [Dehalococcoidales bacterium]|nr:hypothetical protein [Dehalococcoidales bacterium]
MTVPAGHDTGLWVDGIFVEQKTVAKSIVPGATYTDNFTTVISLSGGLDDVRVVADVNGEVNESSESNNRRSNTIAWPPAPDLDISSMYEGWIVNGQSYGMHFTVRNRGNALSPGGHDVALLVDGIEKERKQITVSLNPSQEYSDVFSTNVTLSGGMDKVKVVADINNEVVESNEGNNAYENTIAWPVAPDLHVLSQTEQWVAGKEGTQYIVNFQVRNMGNANAPAGHDVQLKVDGNVIEIDTVPLELSRGGIYIGVFSANVTLSGTSDNITVIADVNNEVAESDETNNSRSNTWPTPVSGVQVSINA